MKDIETNLASPEQALEVYNNLVNIDESKINKLEVNGLLSPKRSLKWAINDSDTLHMEANLYINKRRCRIKSSITGITQKAFPIYLKCYGANVYIRKLTSREELYNVWSRFYLMHESIHGIPAEHSDIFYQHARSMCLDLKNKPESWKLLDDQKTDKLKEMGLL